MDTATRPAITTWTEWEGVGVDGNFIFVIDSWHEDTPAERTVLARALKDIGVTSSVVSAQRLAEACHFDLGHYGYPEGELFPEVCDREGFTHNGDSVDVVRTCTFAVLANHQLS